MAVGKGKGGKGGKGGHAGCTGLGGDGFRGLWLLGTKVWAAWELL